jgi:hypothetical protein
VLDETKLLAAERKASSSGADIEMILDRPHKRSVFVRDPDQMLIEFRCARSGRPVLPFTLPAVLHTFFI